MFSKTFAASLVLGFSAAGWAQTVYTDNFDAPAVVQPGVVATFAGGFSDATDPVYFPSFGNIWASGGNTFATGITLTLSNLPAHTDVNISFLMAFLNSWDSVNGSPAPDNLEVWVDGGLKGSYTSNNAGGSVTDIGGGTLIAQYVQFDTSYFYSDTVVSMAGDPAYTFAHTASTLTVQWVASGAGWQGWSDEGYGIDNLMVTLLPVPEPATPVLFALGLAALARRASRRGWSFAAQPSAAAPVHLRG
jgi:hypothetical protein